MTVLMSKYGFKTKKSISDKVKKYYPDTYAEKIKIARDNRKGYSIDMKTINCDFNAYFLGLLLTDGYIQNETKFGIQLIDRDCIEFISKITGKSYSEYESVKYKNNKTYRIVFSDKEQVQNLKRFGIVCNKSLTLQPPQLEYEEYQYLPYIVRGIIDGDGCIYVTTKGSCAFYICTMSYDFAFWIKEILEHRLYMKDISIKQQANKIWIVSTSLQSNMFKLIALVYDKPYGMMRKYNKLRETFRDYNLGNQHFLLG